MGNSLDSLVGNSFFGNHWIASIREPETTPKFKAEPSFDPHRGFEGKRKERVMPLTKDEMYAAGIPPEEMGFCAGVLLKYRTCVHNNRPWFTNCIHEKHDYLHCKSEDYKLRMMEYEREWRLKKRAAKQGQSEATEASEAERQPA